MTVLSIVFYLMQQQLGWGSFAGDDWLHCYLQSPQHSTAFWRHSSLYSVTGATALCLKYLNIQDSVLVFGRSLGRWDSCVSAYAPVHVPLFMQSEVAPTRMTESTPPRGMLCSVDEDTLFWCKRRGFKPLCVKKRYGIDLSCSQCMPCLLVCSVKEDSLWQGCESNLFVLIFVFIKYLSMHFSSGKHIHFYQVKVK